MRDRRSVPRPAVEKEKGATFPSNRRSWLYAWGELGQVWMVEVLLS